MPKDLVTSMLGRIVGILKVGVWRKCSWEWRASLLVAGDWDGQSPVGVSSQESRHHWSHIVLMRMDVLSKRVLGPNNRSVVRTIHARLLKQDNRS